MNSNSIAMVNCRFAYAALARLSYLGVRDVVISSGARCAPLVWAAAQCSQLRKWTHPDERSAGFFALGAARAAQRPVILICTSGTAGSNYFPAIIEASVSHVPLLVMTADRPPELHGCGAPQTIDQHDLFGRYAKSSVTLPPPDVAGELLDSKWLQSIEVAYAEAMGWPSGPVHLNAPFREPLLPDTAETTTELLAAIKRMATVEADGPIDVNGPPGVPDVQLDQLLTSIRDARRGLLIAGPQTATDSPSIRRLAAVTGFPVLADVASQERFGRYPDVDVISSYDLMLRNSEFAAVASPDLTIRFGGLPTSKVLSHWLSDQQSCTHVLVTDSQPPADPLSTSSLCAISTPSDVAAKLHGRLSGKKPADTTYRQLWQIAQARLQTAITGQAGLASSTFEGHIVAEVFNIVGPDTRVMLGNSMPIRWADMYAWGGDASTSVLFNRGVNGIDGIVSTAVGVAATLGKRVVLMVGDVSLMHDLGGLLPVTRYPVDITIVVLNNDGGGIFSFLPLVQHDTIFDSLIAMPHGRSFQQIAAFYEIPYQASENVADFRQAFKDSHGRSGATLLEFRTDRATTVACEQSLRETVQNLDLV